MTDKKLPPLSGIGGYDPERDARATLPPTTPRGGQRRLTGNVRGGTCLRLRPDDAAEIVMLCDAGAAVTIINDPAQPAPDGWTYVRLRSGVCGWAPSRSVA